MPNRVHLKGTARYEEGRAAGAFYPGYLLEVDENNKLIAHRDAGGVSERAFALESVLDGRTLDDAYATGELVPYLLAHPGDEIYAVLKDGQAVNEGDHLASNGDGTLMRTASEGTGGGDFVIGVCREAVTASGANAFVKIRIV